MPPKKNIASVASAVLTLTRTPIQPAAFPEESNICKIICWNVAGLRGTLKNRADIFDRLVETHSPHVICLQETKIQQSNESDFDDILPTYAKYWCSSTTKKGYSGTAIFVKKMDGSEDSAAGSKPQQSTLMSLWGGGKKRKRVVESTEETPTDPVAEGKKDAAAEETSPSASAFTVQNVSFDLDGDSRFSGEGRAITVEFPSFFLVNTYVPNSGQKLDRLDYRTTEWDPHMYRYLKELEGRGKPVVLTGDLNVAHLDLDIHNPTAKHIAKQAGLTPQERTSFGTLLATGFQDALRFFYPEHEGQFTYWSARTNARPVNKGLRLDYFMCSHSLFVAPPPSIDEGEKSAPSREFDELPSPGVVDSYILFEDTVGCSDHCPIMLVMKV